MPAWMDSQNASRTAGFWNACAYHSVVRSPMGHDCALLSLKEYRKHDGDGDVQEREDRTVRCPEAPAPDHQSDSNAPARRAMSR